LKSQALEGEIIMKMFGARSLAWPTFTVVASLTLVTACGDVDTYKIRNSSWGESEPYTNWDWTYVQLVRATTPCDSEVQEELIVLACADVEFPGEHLAKLKSSCSGGTEAEVTIDIIDGRSIIFDFSTVTKAGVFKAANFNGYVFTELVDAAPDIVGATVDRGVSTLELGEDALSVDGHVLHANFEGISFGEASFLKIDLVFAEPPR
jgi:hypothetical protein